MAKKNLQAAAAGALADMQQTPAQKLAQQAAPAAGAGDPGKGKREKGFTVWTTPDNVQLWKTYQLLKKAELPTIAAFVETALREYMDAHPVTDEEMDALQRAQQDQFAMFR